MKKVLTFCLFVSFAISLYAFERIQVDKLLNSYLENDSELKQLMLEAQKAQLSLNKSKIDNSFNIELSTGTVVIRNENGQTKVTTKPKAELTLPQAANLTVQASTDYSNTADSSFTNTSIGVNVDILSTAPDIHKINLEKAERAVTLANRRLEKRAISAEQEFYTQLKSLLNLTNQIIQEETNLYSDKISFEEVKAKGYAANSSTYRLAQMKVLSDEHSIEASKRKILHEYIVFYMNCGFEIEYSINEDLLDFIPTDFPSSAALDIFSFPQEAYSEIEEATWTHRINSWERKQTKYFSLGANAGYTIGNTATNSDTVDAGVTSSFLGVKLAGGINLPVSNTSEQNAPAFSFSATFNPNTQRKNKLEKKTDELTEQQELLAIQTACSNYETATVKSIQNLEQILWEKETNEQNYEMYKTLTSDLESWYKQGFISESEYLSAKTNMQLYSVRKLMNQLEILIYNDEVQQMFIKEIK